MPERKILLHEEFGNRIRETPLNEISDVSRAIATEFLAKSVRNHYRTRGAFPPQSNVNGLIAKFVSEYRKILLERLEAVAKERAESYVEAHPGADAAQLLERARVALDMENSVNRRLETLRKALESLGSPQNDEELAALVEKVRELKKKQSP